MCELSHNWREVARKSARRVPPMREIAAGVFFDFSILDKFLITFAGESAPSISSPERRADVDRAGMSAAPRGERGE
jgi:hypothetical protein